MTDSLFERTMRGLQQAVDHVQGKDVPGLVVHFPPDADVKAIRARTGLSQEKFAERLRISVGTLRNWEQGRRMPDGPARVLLALLNKNPRIVEETLGDAA